MNPPPLQCEVLLRRLFPLGALRAGVRRFLGSPLNSRRVEGVIGEGGVAADHATGHNELGEIVQQRVPNKCGTASQRYHGFAIAMHWLLAVALVAIFAVGLYMTDLPFSPQRLKLHNWHKWGGVTILLLSIVRLSWRLSHRPPALPQAMTLAMPGWQMLAYHVTHVLMYALFFIVPLVGWAYSSAVGFPIVLFGVVPLPDFVPVDKALAELNKPWHEISAFALAGLVFLHVAAALKHHWVDRDGLLERMLPRGRLDMSDPSQ